MDALRASMLVGTSSLYGLGLDFGVLVGVLIVLVMLGARVYPRVAT